MQRALAFRAAENNQARFYDIDFRAMHDDPVGQVRSLYRWLGEPVSEEFAAGMAHWWQENSVNREVDTWRDTAAYRIDQDQVRSLFADYWTRAGAWTDRGSR